MTEIAHNLPFPLALIKGSKEPLPGAAPALMSLFGSGHASNTSVPTNPQEIVREAIDRARPENNPNWRDTQSGNPCWAPIMLTLPAATKVVDALDYYQRLESAVQRLRRAQRMCFSHPNDHALEVEVERACVAIDCIMKE